jgi:outer membrane protein insertion porin family
MARFALIFIMLVLINPVFAEHDSNTSTENIVEENNIIKKIEITGNKRTETSTILSYLDLKVGDLYTREKASEAVRTLYATEFFSEIKTNLKDGVLHINVEENPVVNQVEIQGDDAIKTDILKAELSLRARSFFSKAKLQRDVNRIIELYSKTGRFATSVKPKIAKLPQNRVDVLFEIKEGEKAKIKKIYFIGNSHFSNNTLKNIINSKEDKLYNILRTNHYDPDIVDYDKVLLTRFYYNHGYVNFKVISATSDIVPSENGFYLTFSIEEGSRFNFGKIDIDSSIATVDVQNIQKLVSVKEGELFNAKIVDDNTNEIIKYLSNKGFPFVKVTSDYKIDNDKKLVNITYAISKSPKVYIGKIKISGNSKTYDYVIRREMKIAEGDPYNAFLLKRSEQRLGNLDFFNKVNITTEKTSKPDVVDLNISIEEKSTASLNLSAGYSNTDGVLGIIGFTERNLLGKGQNLSLNYKKTASTFAAGFGFVEPVFMESDVSAGFSLSASTENNKDSKLGQEANSIPYNSKLYSGSVFISYDITDQLNHQIIYSLQNSKIEDIGVNAPLIVKEQAGESTVSTIGHKLTYDRTDSRIKPTRGYIAILTQSVAGLGGDSRYFRNILQSNHFYPITEDVILKVGGEVGHIQSLGRAVKINENFHLGDQSLRGFEYAGVGPRDKVNELTGALGGTTYYKGTVEMSFPIPAVPKDLDILASVFTDFGNVFNVDLPKNTNYTKANFYNSNNFRASVGFGITWITNMGPLRLDIAKPIKKEPYDKTKVILFSMHTAL